MILLICTLLCVVWYVLAIVCDKRDRDNDYTASRLLAVMFGVSLLIATIIVPISSNYNSKSFLLHHQAISQVIEYSRSEDLSSHERVRVISDIIEINKTISRHKVGSQSYLIKWWYSEEVANLPYLK